MSALYLLSAATSSLPFTPALPSSALPSLDVRLAHRYVDLRRPYLSRLLRLRSDLSHSLRWHLSSQSFLDVSTPVLGQPSPHGAKEFLVPAHASSSAHHTASSHPAPSPSSSSLSPSSSVASLWYALAQSPQQYKQVLMCGGVWRYYQLAHCFRAEGARADRQVEFVQLDMEMAFATQEEVMTVVEDMLRHTLQQVLGWKDEEEKEEEQQSGEVKGMTKTARQSGSAGVGTRWLRMTWREAMERYGVDKPDMRFPHTLHPLPLHCDLLPHPHVSSSSSTSTTSHTPHHHVRGLRLPGLAPHLSTEEVDALHAQHPGVHVVRVVRGKDKWGGEGRKGGNEVGPTRWAAPPTRWAAPPAVSSLLQGEAGAAWREQVESALGGAEVGDLLVLGWSDGWRRLCHSLGVARLQLQAKMAQAGLWTARADELRFLWVTDFPLLDLDSDEVERRLITGGHAGGQASGMSRADVQLTTMHHPFTAAHPDDAAALLQLLATTAHLPSEHALPLSSLQSLSCVRGANYDLVCNGLEMAGGSIRIHQQDTQRLLLQLLGGGGGAGGEGGGEGQSAGSAVKGFEGLLQALSAGAPPHGGIALGLDRLVAMLGAYEEEREERGQVEGRGEAEGGGGGVRRPGDALPIRDVIAFPKTHTGNDLLFHAPAPLTQQPPTLSPSPSSSHATTSHSQPPHASSPHQ